MKSTLASLLALTAFAWAAAQETSDQVVGLDVFTVNTEKDRGYQAAEAASGSRFVTEIQNAPFTLDVLTREFLDDIGAVRLEDALMYSTGTIAFQHINVDESYIYQRGFTTALFLRNGMRRPGTFDAVGAERIEVVKGPSSVLFGITNPGGTVNYISKAPLAQRMTSLRQTIGSWSTTRTELDMGGPLDADGRIRFRLPASYHMSDRSRTYNDIEKVYLSPSVGFQFNPKLYVEVGFEYLNSHEIPVGPTPAVITPGQMGFLPELPRGWTGNTPEHFADFSAAMPSLSVRLGINEHWQFRSNSSFYRRDRDLFNHARGATTLPALLSFRQSQHLITSDRAFQHTSDLVGLFYLGDSKLTVVAGFENRDDYTKFNARNALRPDAAPLVPPSWKLLDPSTWNYDELVFDKLLYVTDTYTNFTANAYSLMFQMEALDERLNLLGGLRRDEGKTNFRSGAWNRVGYTTSKFRMDNTSYQAGALFKFSPQWSVYANHSSSFEPVNATFIDENQQPYSPLPVEGEGFEAGLKTTLLDGSLIQTLALFQIEQLNLRVRLLKQATETTTFTYDSQSGVQRSRGLEYSVNLALNNNLALLAGYAYTDAKVVEDRALPANVGQTLPNSYKHKFDVFGRYTFTKGPVAGLYVGLGYVYVSEAPYAIGALQELKIPGHGFSNLALGYKFRAGEMDWSAQLNVDNLLDEDYYTFINYRADPRNVRLTLGVKF